MLQVHYVKGSKGVQSSFDSYETRSVLWSNICQICCEYQVQPDGNRLGS